jgi:hypothetical protein
MAPRLLGKSVFFMGQFHGMQNFQGEARISEASLLIFGTGGNQKEEITSPKSSMSEMPTG